MVQKVWNTITNTKFHRNLSKGISIIDLCVFRLPVSGFSRFLSYFFKTDHTHFKVLPFYVEQ